MNRRGVNMSTLLGVIIAAIAILVIVGFSVKLFGYSVDQDIRNVNDFLDVLDFWLCWVSLIACAVSLAVADSF